MKTSRWPISHLPISGVTPFTYRDGETYLSMLNRLAQYVTEQLHPSLRETVEHMVEELEHIIAAQHNKYVEGIQDFQQIHDAFMTDVNSALMALNDNAVADLVDDPVSVLGQTLREVFAGRSDFEDVSNNVDTLRETTPVSSTRSTELYVSTGGDDSNNGETEQQAVRTLARVADLIPDVIHRGHTYTVNIDMGVWDEPLRLVSKDIQGRLIIQGITSDRLAHRVHSLEYISCTGFSHVRNIKFTKAGNESGPVLLFESSGPYMRISNVETTRPNEAIGHESNNIGLLADYGSSVFVSDSEFSGRRYGVRSNYNSFIYSRNNTGDNNQVGAAARWGGQLSLYGTQPQGDNGRNVDVNSGGFIVQGMATVGVQESHDVSSDEPFWIIGEHDAGPKKTWSIRPNINHENQDILANQTVRLVFEPSFRGGAPIKANISYGYQVLNGSSLRFIEKIMHRRLTSTSFTGVSEYSVAETRGTGNTSEHMVSMEHAGSDYEFYLDLRPGEADDGINGALWGVDIEMMTFRGVNAPNLKEIRII